MTTATMPTRSALFALTQRSRTTQDEMTDVAVALREQQAQAQCLPLVQALHLMQAAQTLMGKGGFGRAEGHQVLHEALGAAINAADEAIARCIGIATTQAEGDDDEARLIAWAQQVTEWDGASRPEDW